MIANLVAHQPEPLQADIVGQFLDLPGGAQAATGRLDDDDHRVDEIDRRSPEVLDSGVHVQNKNVVIAEKQMGEQGFQHGALRANAARAAQINGAHFEQANIAVGDAETLREVIDARVDGKKSTTGTRFRAGALLDQFFHFDNRFELSQFLLGESQSPGQTGRWVGVHGQNVPATIGINLSQQRGQRRFAHAAFSTNC